MLVQITLTIGDRVVEREITVDGSAEDREEAGHAVGCELGRVVSEAALNELAARASHPSCCGRSMENRGRRAIGLDGPMTLKRTRYRCQNCGRESLPTDCQQRCGCHRVTRPLAKRVCQLATIEHFTRLPQWLFDQHGVRMSHHEIIDLVHDAGGSDRGSASS